MEKDDIISWDEYFMGIAELSAKRSKDPVTKVGACIVDKNNIIVGIGYNGFPRGCNDNMFPWTKEGEYSDTKFGYVVHAELNAILNSNKTKNCRLYCTEYPCAECFKAIIQAGIKEVIYLRPSDTSKPKHFQHARAVKRMAEASGVKLTIFDFSYSYNEQYKHCVTSSKLNISLPPEEAKDLAALYDFSIRDKYYENMNTHE